MPIVHSMVGLFKVNIESILNNLCYRDAVAQYDNFKGKAVQIIHFHLKYKKINKQKDCIKCLCHLSRHYNML